MIIRIRQVELRMPAVFGSIGPFFRTLRYLKLSQVIDRISRRFRVRLPIRRCEARRRSLPNLAWYSLPRPKSLIAANRISLLNLDRELDFPAAWDSEDLDKLWLYHLHYHDCLMSDEVSVDLRWAFLSQWIEENPPLSGTGWEPYPVSLRIVNWAKWLLQGGASNDRMLTSLATQAGVLRRSLEFHLLGNHLFANAKALFFAGAVLDGRVADSFLNLGSRLLKSQIDEQFLPDGGHFELSTTYHATLTEDLLDIIQLGRILQTPLVDEWTKVATSALKWFATMTRPDGRPPLFNDASYGVAPSLAQLTSYAERLNLAIPATVKKGLTALEASGYFRFTAEVYSVFVDAGQLGPDYQPGHAHCDMLSFELFAHDRPIIVDSGVSTYEPGPRRDFERSTTAHNTVQPNSLEQSEMWAAFRVGRRARIVHRSVQSNVLEASHDGFRGWGITHWRRFEFQERALLIQDRLVCAGETQQLAIARFHFSPTVDVRNTSDGVLAEGVQFRFCGASAIRIARYDYAPEFNVLQKAWVLEVEFSEELATHIVL